MSSECGLCGKRSDMLYMDGLCQTCHESTPRPRLGEGDTLRVKSNGMIGVVKGYYGGGARFVVKGGQEYWAAWWNVEKVEAPGGEKPLSDLLASGASPTRQQIEDDGYAILRDVFANAVEQASGGKGKERHANGSPFVDQPILAITRLLTGHPCGALAYQAIKKTIEAGRLVELKGTDAAVAELRGAMNYIATMVIYLEEQASKGKP